MPLNRQRWGDGFRPVDVHQFPGMEQRPAVKLRRALMTGASGHLGKMLEV